METQGKNNPENRQQNAVNNYLGNYQTASAPQKSWQTARHGTPRIEKATAENKSSNVKEKRLQKDRRKYEKEPKKKNSIGWLVLLAVVALIAAGICLYAVLPHDNTADLKNTAESEISAYVGFTEDALSVSTTFKTMAWMSSDEALAAFVEILNPSLSSEWKITYTEGASFAEGKKDPWGNPYFITAKKIDYERNNGFPFEFYITSAGKNGYFDTVKFVLDKDDVYSLLFSMEKYIEMNGEHSIINPDDIGATEKESVPITFDMGEGTGGTAFLAAIPGEMLPDISVPTREGYLFTGYYEFKNAVGVRYWDKDGKGCVPSPFEAGATVYAGWEEEPVYDPKEIQIEYGYGLGDKIPDFTFTTHNGAELDLYQILEEKEMVLLCFWASECDDCSREFPKMEAAYQLYKDEIEILASSCIAHDSPEVIAQYVSDLGLTFPAGKTNSSLLTMFNLNAVPSIVAIDRNGVICYIESEENFEVARLSQLFNVYVADDYTESIVLTELPEIEDSGESEES